jgi:hypothetical protein
VDDDDVRELCNIAGLSLPRGVRSYSEGKDSCRSG